MLVGVLLRLAEQGTGKAQPYQPRKRKQKEDKSVNIEGYEVVRQAQRAQIIRIRFDVCVQLLRDVLGSAFLWRVARFHAVDYAKVRSRYGSSSLEFERCLVMSPC